MKAIEMILAQIGEFVFTEMIEVKNISYNLDSKGEQTSFVILFDNGKEFVIEIKPK